MTSEMHPHRFHPRTHALGTGPGHAARVRGVNNCFHISGMGVYGCSHIFIYLRGFALCRRPLWLSANWQIRVMAGLADYWIGGIGRIGGTGRIGRQEAMR